MIPHDLYTTEHRRRSHLCPLGEAREPSISRAIYSETRLPFEDSSDFEDFWTELILTTRSIIWDIFRFSQFFVLGGCQTFVGWSLDGRGMVFGRLFSQKYLYFQISSFNWPGLGHRSAAPALAN